MNSHNILILSAAILLMLAGFADAAESSREDTLVLTNVHFCKIVPEGTTHTLEPLLTTYLGENDYGRETFVVMTDHLETGDYALVQDTKDGLNVIQVLSIEAKGADTEDFVALRLELRKEELPAPIVIIGSGDETTTPAATSPAATAQQMTMQGTAPATTTQKSPLATGLPVLVLVLGAGCLVAAKKRE